MDSIPLKRCTQCGVEKPATPEYFYRCAKVKCGLKSYCKECDRAYDKRTADRTADYLKRNAQRIAEYTRAYQKKNAEHLSQYRQSYYQTNFERIARRKREYDREKPYVKWLCAHRRRARKLALPDTFKPHHWLSCLGYWHYCCAVCGYPLKDVFGNVPHADHWIPLDDKRPGNPGTVPENMICLCDKCNLTKNKKDPVIWLNKRYSKHKAQSILERIRKYFDWIKSQ